MPPECREAWFVKAVEDGLLEDASLLVERSYGNPSMTSDGPAVTGPKEGEEAVVVGCDF